MSRTHEERFDAVYAKARAEKIPVLREDLDFIERTIFAELEADGWQVVPVEPTPEMTRPGGNLRGKANVYRTMCRAAPSPLDHQPSQHDSPDHQGNPLVPEEAGDTHDG